MSLGIEAPRLAPEGWPLTQGRSFAWRFIVLATVLIAFNDLLELLPIGELAHDAFVYAVPVLALVLYGLGGRFEVPRPLFRFGLAFLVVVFIGILFNFGEIAQAFFKGRTGLGRVVTQGMAFGFGLAISLLFFRIARLGMVGAVVRGARLAILVMAGMGLLEIASWYSVPGLADLHLALSTVVHGDSGADYVQRLRMTAFEVSWAGALLSFFLPFAAVSLRGEQRAARFYVALAMVLVVLTQSRTALLVVGFQLILLFWSSGRRGIDLVVHGLAILAVAGIVLVSNVALYQRVAELASNVIEYGTATPGQEDAEENTSNITRSVNINAAFTMFLERPLLGVGLGQFGFHYGDFVHAEDLRSWEVREYLDDGLIRWPPTYSIHTRLLSETGLGGYLLWLGFVVSVMTRAFRRAASPMLDDELRGMHFAVAVTLLGVLLLGFSIDSFRFFGVWIAIGIGLGLPPDSPDILGDTVRTIPLPAPHLRMPRRPT